MRIEDYGPQVRISRSELNSICARLINDLGPAKLWNSYFRKHIFRYGCFDEPVTWPEFQGSKYFGNLGVEIEESFHSLGGRKHWHCNGYAHFNLRGVNPEHFGIYRDWKPGEFAPFMKNHPAIWKRVERIKEQCDFINIHIHDDISIEWGP